MSNPQLLTLSKGGEGLHVVLQAGQPASYGMGLSLVSELITMPRIARVTVAAFGNAGDFAEKLGSLGFAATHEDPASADAAIVFNEPPRWLALRAKGLYRCRTLVMVAPGIASTEVWRMEDFFRCGFDAVCVDDALGAGLFEDRHPFVESSRVMKTGSALTDALRFDISHLRRSARDRLSLADDERVLFFSGFPSADYAELGGGNGLLVDACGCVIGGIRQSRSMDVLVVRSHPRSPDCERSQVERLCAGGVPGGMRVILDPDLSFDATLAASDAVVCMPTSTLANLARYRGKVALMLACGQAGAVFSALFSPVQERTLASTPGIIVLREVADMYDAREAFTPPAPAEAQSSARILALL